ncbi:MAG: hypothetical protein QGG53_45540 [Planctomycetota bacterium]|nr:hypothetical protein [Planctomycetota bacterium]
MFNRTERLYLLYAETQGFINPEQASSAEKALRAARESGQEAKPWDLLREWQYLSPEQTNALFNAVERAVGKCERHPLVVSGSPTAETTEYPAVGEPFGAPSEPHPVMPAVPSLPPTPVAGTPAMQATEPVRPEPDTVSPVLHDTPTPLFDYVAPQEVEPETESTEMPGFAAEPEESPAPTEPEKPSLVIPSLVPQQKQDETETKPDPEVKKKTKVRKKKKTESAKKEKTKPNPVTETGEKAETAPTAAETPTTTRDELPVTETPPADETTASKPSAEESAETPTDSRETESSDGREVPAASKTTEPSANLPDDKAETKAEQSKLSKPETTITRRSRTEAAKAQSQGSSAKVAAAIAAVLILCGGIYFYVENSDEEKPKRLKMTKTKGPEKELTRKEGVDAIFGADDQARTPIGGRGETTARQPTETEKPDEKEKPAETNIATDQQEEAITGKAEQGVTEAAATQQQTAQEIRQAQRKLRQEIQEDSKQLIPHLDRAKVVHMSDESLLLTPETSNMLHLSQKGEVGKAKRLRIQGNSIGFWTDKKDFLSWVVENKDAGHYKVILEYSKAGNKASQVEIRAGRKKIVPHLKPTGDWNKKASATLEDLHLDRGRQVVAIYSKDFQDEVINMFSLTLQKGNQQQQPKPNNARKTQKPAEKEPTKSPAQLKKEMKDLADFFAQEDRIWLGNETFKGKHDGVKNIMNIYEGSPVPKDGKIKSARIFTNAPRGTLCPLFLLRKKGNKLKVIERKEFRLEANSKEYIKLENLNWNAKKDDLLAHWGIAPARKHADTSDECYVLAKEPAKNDEISLTGKKKLSRRKYALRAEFVEQKEEEKK